MRIRVLIVFVVGWAASPIPAAVIANELTCVFEVTRVTVQRVAPNNDVAGNPVVDAKPERTTQTHQTVIGLSKNYVSLTDEGARTEVFQFPLKRIYTLDLHEKTYEDLSLYGLVAYRVNELVNRRGMEEGFFKKEPKNVDPGTRELFDQFNLESVFSRRLPDDAAKPDAPIAKEVRQGAESEFSHKGRRFVRFVASKHPIPTEYRQSWNRFLVHGCRIHPTIRERIVKAGVVPEILEYFYRENEESTTTFRLLKVTEGPEQWTGIPAGFKPKLDPADRLGHVLAKLDAKAVDGSLRTSQQASKYIDEELMRGNTLDAYLGLIEYSTLSSNDGPDAISKAALTTKLLARNDAQIASLRFRRSTRDEADSILKAIDKISRKGLKKGYQLDAIRGFVLVLLRRNDEANDSFLKALEANPYLSNCYKQLADNYYQDFYTGETWRCYDAIRQFDPNYELLKGANDLQAQFEKDFPDDF